MLHTNLELKTGNPVGRRNKSWREAALFVIGCVVIGFAGSVLGGVYKKQDWYDGTKKPAIWPPQWFFPLVWVGNYTFLGLATWQVWTQRNSSKVSGAFGLFAVHFLHNFAFLPAVNTVKKRSFYTFMDTIGLTSGIVTTVGYSRVSRPATLLMLPYLGWLGFTTFIKFLWWRMEDKQEK